MFGTLKPQRCRLDPAEGRAHQNFYCGLCKSLDVHFSPFHRALVNYDAVFMAIVTEALLEEPEARSQCRCPMNPLLTKGTVAPSEVSMKFAAAVQLLLADSWLADRAMDGHGLAKASRRLLSPSFKKAHRMLSKLGVSLDELQNFELRQKQIEEQDKSSPSQAAEPTAEALGIVMTKIADLPGAAPELKTLALQEKLRSFGRSLGRMIYFNDALEDLEKDLKKGQFNPCLSKSPSGQTKISKSRFQNCLSELKHDLHALPSIIQELPWRRHQGLIENIVLTKMRRQSQDAARSAHQWICSSKEEPKAPTDKFELIEDAFDNIEDSPEDEEQKKKKKRPEDPPDDGDYGDEGGGGRRRRKKRDNGCDCCECCEECQFCGLEINFCGGNQGCVNFECCECSACECSVCECSVCECLPCCAE